VLTLLLSSYGAYSLFLQLGYSLAAVTALLGDWLWPLISFVLQTLASGVRWLGCWLERAQELGESAMCDWAALWCEHFPPLMCHRRCGFVERLWARAAGGGGRGVGTRGCGF